MTAEASAGLGGDMRAAESGLLPQSEDLIQELPLGFFLGDFTPLVIAELMILVPSLFLPPLFTRVPLSAVCQTVNLCAGSASPWGVVTSIFLFDSSTNLVLLGLILLIFISVNWMLPGTERRRRAAYCTLAMFACGVGSNLLFIVVYPHLDSFGPSGVMYAFLGGMVGFAAINIVKARAEPQERTTRTRRALILLNAVIVILVPTFFILNPVAFLSESAHANAFVHASSLIGGIAMAVGYARPVKIKPTKPKVTLFTLPRDRPDFQGN